MSKSGIIAVAGAGIAGIGASIAITLAGFRCKTFERESHIKPLGAGIQLGPTATRILKRWDVPLPESACAPEHIELRNASSGKLINTIPLGQAFMDRYGAPYITLLRAELQAALLNRSNEIGCDLRLASPVKFLGQSDGGVKIETPEGIDEISGLIAADGVQSATRGAISTVTSASGSVTIWRTLLSAKAFPATYRNQVTVWMADGAHLVHYPVDGGERINVVLAADGAFDAIGLEGWKGVHPPNSLIRTLSAVPRAAIDAAETWTVWPVLTVPRWKGGAHYVQAIGDAWHAMPPFLASGAVMAVEDADALAESLRASNGHAIEGLETFRELRSKRVWRVWDQSHQMGRIYHLGMPFAAMRDLTLRSMSSSVLAKRNDWLYAANA